MSLATVWSGNFHQLRSSFGNNYSYKFLRFHSVLIPQKVLDARRCNLQTLATKIDGTNQKSQSNKPYKINLNVHDGTTKSSSSVNTDKSELHAFNAVQNLNLQHTPDKSVFQWPATVLVFDIETTGFSRQKERIIEFAARDLIGGKNSTFQSLVNPGKDITNTYIHGIRSDMVNRPDVPRFEELIPILLQYVRSRQMDGKPVVWIAHNGRRFDVPFLINEFQRCSMEVPEDWLFVDTLPLARQLSNPDGSKLASFSLEALREHYGIPLVGPAHRAMQDVTILSYVLQRITFDLKLTILKLMDGGVTASEVSKASRGQQSLSSNSQEA